MSIYIYHSSKISKAGDFMYMKLFCYDVISKQVVEKRIKIDQFVFVPFEHCKGLETNGKLYKKYRIYEMKI